VVILQVVVQVVQQELVEQAQHQVLMELQQLELVEVEVVELVELVELAVVEQDHLIAFLEQQEPQIPEVAVAVQKIKHLLLVEMAVQV
tara:strand:- start:33 stop:296 length:264 start_codon:yes stop_codon:yes gene_type:complete